MTTATMFLNDGKWFTEIINTEKESGVVVTVVPTPLSQIRKPRESLCWKLPAGGVVPLRNSGIFGSDVTTLL